MKVKEFFYDVRALNDEYNDDGIVIADGEVADIEANSMRFLNMAIAKFYKKIKFFRDHIISNDVIPNLLSTNGGNFVGLDFIGEDRSFPEEGVVGAKSYFFSCTSDFTVYIEEHNGSGWNAIEGHTITAVISELTDYKGLITPTDPAYPIRLRFSGSTFYRYYNRGLFSYPFKADAIPDYGKTLKYTMPDDFATLEEIILENPNYIRSQVYKWEGLKTLAVDYRYKGLITVKYKPTPVVLTDENEEIPVYDPVILEAIKYDVAAKVAVTENSKLVNYYQELSDEAYLLAFREPPSSAEPIQDVLGLDCIDNGWW